MGLFVILRHPSTTLRPFPTGNPGVGFSLLVLFLLFLFQNWLFFFFNFENESGTSLMVQWLRIHLPMKGTQVPSLGQEDPLEKEMATHSSILAWEIARTEKPGRLQSVGLQRVGHNRATKTTTTTLPLGLSEAWAPVCIIHITWVRRDPWSPAPSAGVKAAASSPAPQDSPPPTVSLAWSRLPELLLSRCKHPTQLFSPQS